MLLGSAVNVNVGAGDGGGTAALSAGASRTRPPRPQAPANRSSPRIATRFIRVWFSVGMISSSLSVLRTLPSVEYRPPLKLCEALWSAVAAATAFSRLDIFCSAPPPPASASPLLNWGRFKTGKIAVFRTDNQRLMLCKSRKSVVLKQPQLRRGAVRVPLLIQSLSSACRRKGRRGRAGGGYRRAGHCTAKCRNSSTASRGALCHHSRAHFDLARRAHIPALATVRHSRTRFCYCSKRAEKFGRGGN